MSNYLKIIFKCDLILQIFFYILGGGGDHFQKYGKKFGRKNTPPLRGEGGTIFRRNTRDRTRYLQEWVF